MVESVDGRLGPGDEDENEDATMLNKKQFKMLTQFAERQVFAPEMAAAGKTVRWAVEIFVDGEKQIGEGRVFDLRDRAVEYAAKEERRAIRENGVEATRDVEWRVVAIEG